ncbi:MAG: hypothetical protein RRX92_05705 [Lachnospiraceae bacterium]
MLRRWIGTCLLILLLAIQMPCQSMAATVSDGSLSDGSLSDESVSESDYSDEIKTLMAYVKEKLAKGELNSEEEVKQAIQEGETEYKIDTDKVVEEVLSNRIVSFFRRLGDAIVSFFADLPFVNKL